MRTLFILILASSIASCKDPLPVYFDKPIGEKIAVFPEDMRGYYYSLDDIINEGKKKAMGNYFLKEDQISIKDTLSLANATEPNNDISDSTKNETGSASVSVDSALSMTPKKINDFYKIARLNKLSFNYVDTIINNIDKKEKIVFGFLKIAADKISLLYIDSLGHNNESTLLKLDEQLQLTSYLGANYLNFKTPFGWEIMQIDAWDNGTYLNFVQFYFTDYDDQTGDEKCFLSSTQNIYPKLKPIYNSEKLIIGVKGNTKPNLLIEKFKKSEFSLVLLKVE